LIQLVWWWMVERQEKQMKSPFCLQTSWEKKLRDNLISRFYPDVVDHVNDPSHRGSESSWHRLNLLPDKDNLIFLIIWGNIHHPFSSPRNSHDPICEHIFHYRFWNFRKNLPYRKVWIIAHSELYFAEFFFRITRKEEVTWCEVWSGL
jgi:hypothetical protein